MPALLISSHYLLGSFAGTTTAIASTAEVIDHDLGAQTRQL
mgnify:CR=1 FL=1